MVGLLGWSVEELESVESRHVVIRDLLASHAQEAPDQVFVTFEDGLSWTRLQVFEIGCAAANVLQARGVGTRDRVAVFLPNGPEFLAAWFGTALLGATVFPINTAFRGSMLRHALQLGDAAALISSGDLTARVDELGPSALRVVPAEELRGTDSSVPDLTTSVGLWDDELLLMTSGTTGPSKLVRIPYLYPYAGYASILAGQGFGPDDTYLVDLPLFHMAAAGYVHSALITGSRIHVRSRPSLTEYWEILRDHQISATVLVSSMIPLLLAQPVTPAERQHRLKYLLAAPAPADISMFKERFAVPTVLTCWGGTEMCAPVLGEAEPGQSPGYCGQLRPGFDVRLVDENDQFVPTNSVGQGIVRAIRPFMMSSGYFGNQEATLDAWRHGWFHTGDLLRQDENGDFHFVDRAADSIRRRGENVSAYEVEIEISAFPGIVEVAVVAAPSDTGVDHDVKAWLVVEADADLDLSDLVTHCASHLPHFMVPRYFEVIEELPKTPSAKVQKYLLRERGNGETTWDAEAHGLVVTRHGLERHA